MVGEYQLLGNRIANLIFSFFCMVLFQSLLVQKLFKIVSFNLLFQEELRLGYQDHQQHFFGSIFRMCGEWCLYLRIFQH